MLLFVALTLLLLLPYSASSCWCISSLVAAGWRLAGWLVSCCLLFDGGASLSIHHLSFLLHQEVTMLLFVALTSLLVFCTLLSVLLWCMSSLVAAGWRRATQAIAGLRCALQHGTSSTSGLDSLGKYIGELQDTRCSECSCACSQR
jgi:hypothetical protein